MSRLQEEYLKNIKPNLMKELNLKNIYSVPELKKIVINMGLGLDANDKKKLEAAVEDLKKISGQKPTITKTKKAIANFKTKKDMPIGCKVTLRKNRMYEFIDRLINIALPRSKDFAGLSEKNFDGLGNYTFGVKEHIIFPEIDFDKIDKVKGMDITIVTSTNKNKEAKSLLKAFNFPLNK
ncbi:MAG: 50S ribosomal protein L5 [Alphaproteobacteria bacterium MarineAlpha6_Bin6]|nr:50S ribosomal protein L5 [Pelagibacteraceae bacterium]PPR31716.1 MAG: 50S ribosomal protein L5 [Alphaproteobacteria bacterium MarineAlpha6_Bin6]PPR32675.1 MAG: 50S ribosomal protein L5 [Alphaproteobacteria bacterium MarineAlpha6_Bin5]|tara:strand:+ start:608 stop:1147 length:540 start_codon:yes stop_codon:yes gene_type:complete